MQLLLDAEAPIFFKRMQMTERYACMESKALLDETAFFQAFVEANTVSP